MSGSEIVDVALLRLDPGVPAPQSARDGDAGADLATTENVEIAPGERVLVGTGVALALPAGWVGLVHPRSGLAARHGLTIVNAPGTVDSGYRGEIKVCLLNTDPRHTIALRRGDLIAQLVDLFPGIAPRDIKMLLRLALRVSKAHGEPLDVATFRRCAMFRAITMKAEA